MPKQSEKDGEITERPTRNLFFRILSGGLWFVGLYFITCMIVGGIAAVFAGTSKYKSGAEASAAGSQAGDDFTSKYGPIVFLSYFLLFIILLFFRLLPGVGKYKKSKPQGP